MITIPSQSKCLQISIQVGQLYRLRNSQIQPNTDQIWVQIQTPQADHRIQTRRLYLGESLQEKEMASLIRNKTLVVDQQAATSVYSKVLSNNNSSNLNKYVSCELKYQQAFYYNAASLKGDLFTFRIMGSRGLFDISNVSTKILRLQNQRSGDRRSSKRDYIVGQGTLSIRQYSRMKQNRVADIGIPIKVHGITVGQLTVNLSFYRGQQIVGSISSPNLSLAPLRFPLPKNQKKAGQSMIKDKNNCVTQPNEVKQSENKENEQIYGNGKKIQMPTFFNCCEQSNDPNSNRLQFTRNLFKAKRLTNKSRSEF